MRGECRRPPPISPPARNALRLPHVLLGLACCCQPGPRGGPHGGCPIEVSTAHYFYGTQEEHYLREHHQEGETAGRGGSLPTTGRASAAIGAG